MTNQSPEPEETDDDLFAQALDLPDGEREIFLKSACKGSSARQERILVLLRASAEAKDFMEAPPLVDLNKLERPVADQVGQLIGRYKLLQKIGEGGCGAVYMAEQEEPVHRRVALKVIKLGMDTQAVITRFEAERQALALMDHPNIARVLDAGATETGRPYFVMELVRGIKITDYCDQHKFTTAQRLALFEQVCLAVQHAHQKGIIHRDLKPSNILITLQDGMPVPKVIDFGIAKATQGRLTDHTLFTAFEQFIGTPAYMSPEQAEMTSQDVDTRSDVYSLGVLLYELLTGKAPFDPQTFRQAGIDEIRRFIREVEPPKPSLRLSTLSSADSVTVAQLRGTDAPKLSIMLQGDIDWIIMKALDKNRTRRYETASAFAADITRHLRNEPVVARPPSKGYLLTKFIRRNRGGFLASTAVMLVLIVGLGVSTWMMVKEHRARERAVAAEKAQTAARTQAEAEEAKAKVAAAKSKQAYKFIEGMLTGVGPSVAAGRDTTLLREILDKTVKRLETKLDDEPEVALSLRITLAATYLDLGDYGKAEPMARDALALAEKLSGRESEDVAGATMVLGEIQLMQGHVPESESLLRKALEIARKNPGVKNETLASALVALGNSLLMQMKLPEAEPIIREALELTRHADLDTLQPETVQMLLASVLQKEGRLAEAEPEFAAALVGLRAHVGPDNPSVGYAQMGLSNLLMAQGKLNEAETQFRAAMVILQKSLGAEHPTVAMVGTNLAMILMQSGRVQEAEERCREALALQKKILGPEHATTQQTEGLLRLLLDMQKKSTEAEKISTVSSEAKNPEQEEIAAANKKAELAVAAMSRQKFAEAEAALRAALPVFEKAFGRKRQDVIGVRILLARTLLQNDKPTEAAQVTGELLADCRSVFGNQSSYLSNILILQALALQYDGKLSEAESALQEEITNAKGQTTDGKNVNVAMGLLLLASIKAEQGKLDDRDRMIGEAISMIQTAPKNIILGSCQMIETTAKYLMKRGRYGDAEAVEQVVVSSVRQLIGRDSDELAWVLTTYSWMESDAGKLVEAEASAREAWAIRQKILPPGHWLIATAEYSVAEWLYKQKKIDESEASFLDTFANLQIHGPENSDPRYNFWRERLMYSADYLKQIYTDKGQPEKAAEWKAKSAMYKVADETKDAAEQK